MKRGGLGSTLAALINGHVGVGKCGLENAEQPTCVHMHASTLVRQVPVPSSAAAHHRSPSTRIVWTPGRSQGSVLMQRAMMCCAAAGR